MIDGMYVVSGFLVGGIVGMTGVGGGSLMTPLLVLFFGVAPTTAVGTDLLYAAITKAGGVWANQRRHNIEWRLVGHLALGSLPASVITIVLLNTLSFDHARLSAIMSTALGFALILTALALLMRDSLRQLARRGVTPSPNQKVPTDAKYSTAYAILIGVTLGILVTLSSVGAGALGVTALTFIAPGLATVRIVGTDIAHAVPLTLVAGLGHAASGGVNWQLLASLLVGSLPGIWVGSAISQRLPEKVLRGVLAAVLVVVGAKLAL
jgi:uncharacterized membrane protein YfcA